MKGNRQIIDSTPVIANITIEQHHWAGEEVPGECAEDDREAGYQTRKRLGLKELQNAKKCNTLLLWKKGFRKRSRLPVNYLIMLSLSLK